MNQHLTSEVNILFQLEKFQFPTLRRRYEKRNFSYLNLFINFLVEMNV